MKRNHIWQAIELELRAAKKLQPNWPDHVCAQAGIVTKESGELMQACLDRKYDKAEAKQLQELQIERIRKTAIQSAVSAIRFLENLKETL